MPRRYIDRRAEIEIEALLAQQELNQQRDVAPAEDGTRAGQPAGRVARRVGDWQGLVEQRIQDGIEKGMFDNLQGMGKPLNLDDDRFVPEEYKMAFRMLRSTGLTPLWIDLNKEIRADLDRLVHFREWIQARGGAVSAVELRHRREEYSARVAAINSKILSHNIIAPASRVHIALLIPEQELARFDEATRE